MLEKAGVGVGGYRTEELADFGSVLHRPEAAEAAILRAGVERTYDRFKALAAESRHRTPEQIEAVAEGRVWTGAQALEAGLVDGLGDLSDAVKLAGRLGGLAEDAPVRLYDAEIRGVGAIFSRLVPAALMNVLLPGGGGRELFAVSASAGLPPVGRPLALAGVPEAL